MFKKLVDSLFQDYDKIILTRDIEEDIEYLSKHNFNGEYTEQKVLISTPSSSLIKDKKLRNI